MLFGWENNFKQPNLSEIAAVVADVDWVLNIDSLDVSELKPKTERSFPWYVGNSSRIVSMTYDSEYKPGSGSISGQLKHARPIATVLGVTSLTNQTTYYQVQLSDGSVRESYFLYFNHGANRAKSLNGCISNEISIEGKEGDFVTYDMSLISAKMFNIAAAFIDPTKITEMTALDTSPFHWKHCAIKIVDDVGGVATNLITEGIDDTQFESFKITIKNNTEFKFGAPSTGGQKWASWYKETTIEAEIELTLYPSTTDGDFLWSLGPEETEYIDYYIAGGPLAAYTSLGIEITLQRDTNDFIRFRFDKLVVEAISESLEAIDSGVDPVTITFKLAESLSSIDVYSDDPILHTDSNYKWVTP